MADREPSLPPSSRDVAGEEFLFHLYRGSELLQDNRVHEAKAELEHALALQPTDHKGQDLLGIVYFRLGLYPRALEIFGRLARAFPEAHEPRVNLALTYLKTGQPEQARRELEHVLQRNPRHARAWGYLGLAFQFLGDRERAIHAFAAGHHEHMVRRLRAEADAANGAPTFERLDAEPPREPSAAPPTLTDAHADADAERAAATFAEGALDREGFRVDVSKHDEPAELELHHDGAAWPAPEPGASTSTRATRVPDSAPANAEPPPAAPSQRPRSQRANGAHAHATLAADADIHSYTDVPSARPFDAAVSAAIALGTTPPRSRAPLATLRPLHPAEWSKPPPSFATGAQLPRPPALPDEVRFGAMAGLATDTMAVPTAEVSTPSLREPALPPSGPILASGPETPTAFARRHLFVFPRDHAVALHPSGSVLVRATEAFVTRIDLVRSMAHPSGCKMNPVLRKMRGRPAAEALGGAALPLHEIEGRGEIVLAPPPGGQLHVLGLDGTEGGMVLREDVLGGFERSLKHESGRVATGDGDAMLVLFLTGSGSVVVSLPPRFAALEVAPQTPVLARAHALLGWVGRLQARALSASEAPAHVRGYLEVSGEGMVLLDGR